MLVPNNLEWNLWLSRKKSVPLQAVKRTMQLIVVLLYAIVLRAEQPQNVGVEYFDSVEVSLLTCAPHEEVYSLYGHTALRWHDLHTGQDLAFNWGMFNFRKPYFAFSVFISDFYDIYGIISDGNRIIIPFFRQILHINAVFNPVKNK